jgi:hypothetical protein
VERHRQKPRPIRDGLDHEAHEETIVERAEAAFGIGRFVRGTDHRDERHPRTVAPTVEDTFVDEAKEAIEDGRIGLEDLVEEGHFGLRQIAIGHPPVVLLFETFERNRSKQFVGVGEPGQQVLEGARPPRLHRENLGQSTGEHRLRRTRRSE